MAHPIRCPACGAVVPCGDALLGAMLGGSLVCPTCQASFQIGDAPAAPPVDVPAELVAEIVPEPPGAPPVDVPVGRVVEIVPERPARPARPPRPHPGFWWTVLWCLGILIVTQLLPGLVGGVFLVLGSGMKPDAMRDPKGLLNSPLGAQVMLGSFMLSQVLSVSMALMAIWLFMGKTWPRRIALRRPNWSHVLLALIGLPGLIVLVVGVDGLARQVLPKFMDLDETMAMFGKWPWYLGVLVIGVGPGIGEELWFRGFIGRGLVGRYGVVVGVLLTSIFFGLIHLEPHQAAYAAFMGIFLHLAYLASRSLWVPMLLHAANNSLSILAQHISALQAVDASADQIPWTVYGAAVLLVAAVGWAFYRSRTQLVPRPKSDGPAWRPAFPGVEYPPLGTATQVQRRAPDPLSWLLTAASVAIFAGVVWAGLAGPDTKGQERKAATTPSARLGILWEKRVRFGPPMWINYRGGYAALHLRLDPKKTGTGHLPGGDS